VGEISGLTTLLQLKYPGMCLSLNVDVRKDFLMKRLKPLIFITVTFFICAGPLHAADLEDGIFGLKWGTSLSNLNEYSKLWSSSKITFYTKPGEVRVINNITVREIVYGANADQFFAVYINIDTLEVFDDFRRYMNSKYGIPNQNISMKDDLTIYSWEYKDTHIKLKLYGKKNSMKLAFYYAPLSGKVNEVQQEKYQAETFRLFPFEKGRSSEYTEGSTTIPLLQF
jgi:hypothetical protein